MLIGKHIIDGIELLWYEKDDKYHQLEDNKKIELSKVYLSEQIANYWSFDSIHNTTKKQEDNTYLTTKFIPIYDWIFIELYGYGKTKEESIFDVENRFKIFIDYNEKLEENINRNKRIFMGKIKKFGYLPKKRDEFDIHCETFLDSEIIYFDDCELDFRELAIKNGVPSDARADGPIFGYVNENNLVFFKFGFINKQKEFFLKFIEENHKNIAKHYGLTKYTLYKQVIPYYNREVDNNDVLLENMIDKDFDYYVPALKIGDFTTN